MFPSDPIPPNYVYLAVHVIGPCLFKSQSNGVILFSRDLNISPSFCTLNPAHFTFHIHMFVLMFFARFQNVCIFHSTCCFYLIAFIFLRASLLYMKFHEYNFNTTPNPSTKWMPTPTSNILSNLFSTYIKILYRYQNDPKPLISKFPLLYRNSLTEVATI